MTEHDYFQNMILEHAVNDATVKAKVRASSGSRRYVCRKIAAVLAVCAAVLIGTVFAIPSARAEMLKWFGSADALSHRSDERISSYLADDETGRAENPALAPLISTPDPDGDGAVTLPIDRTESNAINSEAALAVSDFLHENNDIALGDAIYDGETIYQSIRLNGLSGLWLLEEYVGSFETAVPVDPEAMTGMYPPEMLTEYLSGEKALYEHPNGWIFYEMPDGSRHGGGLELSDTIDPYLDTLRKEGLTGAERTDEQQRILSEQNRAYLNENSLVAVAQITPYADDWEHYWEQFTDENGNMTVKVFYKVAVVEEDRAGGELFSDTDLYSAELGTITINMNAYRSLPQATLSETDASSVTWGPETAVISYTDTVWAADGSSVDHNAFTKYQVSMEGVTMRLETETATINALGIRNIGIRVTVPDTWTDAEREALFCSLQFKLLINGESGDWGVSFSLKEDRDGSFVWTVQDVWNVPDETAASIRTISVCPVIYRVDQWVEHAEYPDDDTILRKVDPPIGETTFLNLSEGIWSGEDTTVDYPQYTLTLNVD